MVFSIPRLHAFVQFVPCCAADARLAEVLASLEPGTGTAVIAEAHDRVVLVDSEHHAIGWVSAEHLLQHLVATGLVGPRSASQVEPQESVASLRLQDITPSIVEPLVSVEADLALDAFLPRLQQHPRASYALMDTEGRFLGLLNNSRLLQVLTAHSTVLPPPTDPAPAITVSPAATLLNPLLQELIEYLPLPVMLQTGDGRVLAQNAIWRTQISELLDPVWLRQEAATLLELPLTEPSALEGQPSDRRAWAPLEPSPPDIAPYDRWTGQPRAAPVELKPQPEAANLETQDFGQVGLEDGFGAMPSASSAGGSCQLGSKPGTCICVCPLKDGQEQILQFVRIPLGQLSSQAALNLGDRARSLETPLIQTPTAPSQLFRLAALLSTLQGDAPTAPKTSTYKRAESEQSIDRPLESTFNDSDAASEELWLILAQDVTEQQQLARELTAKNADLIQLNRLKDEFLACISHELRTPLTAVLGLSSLLKDQTLGALNPRQVHYAQLIYQSGRHLMAVVNDILDLTRMETGQLQLVLAPVDLAAVCQRAFEQAQQLQLQEGGRTGTELAPAQPTFSLTLEPGLELLMADEQRLRQMLVHLLSNAIKFTEPTDAIGLKVGHWGGWIALTVWDTGIGIPAEKQHLIFQKFQQLENPLTRRFEGTGLGLVLTQRLARLHGGDVTFISKEGEGSQFTILLPPNSHTTHNLPKPLSETIPPLLASERSKAARSRNEPEQSTHTASGASPVVSTGDYAVGVSASQRSQLVLIVEAVPQFIEMLSDELTGLGYRVVIARSGTEALEKARRLQPCIIFLNPVLPLLSGWDVLTLLKASAETQHIPVVIMATKVDEEQAHQRQADHLLSLPIQPKRLQKCLQQLVLDRQEVKRSVHPASILTVLRLSPGDRASQQQPLVSADLDAMLHSCQYRILEADDLEQAELLARVWKPNVVLLDGVLADAELYFRLYCQHIFLASLPLVTIDQTTSQVANQTQGLLVFPCLSPSGDPCTIEPAETSALLQAIQIAAGYAWRPLVLAIDAPVLPMSLEAHPSSDSSSSRVLNDFPMEREWLQALTQYLQTADLRSSVGRCWQEVLQQLESHSVDVLIICWTDTIAQSYTMPMLSSLQQLRKRPPILVLDHREYYKTTESTAVAPLPEVLQQLAATILPASLPMTELLHHILLVMKANHR
ncbi:MAG: ATP-binding protein [Leptolyngbya sp. BL-A-14]